MPVCAVANTSRPSRAGGIAPTCTGVSVIKFALARRCLSVAEIGNAENSFKMKFLASGLLLRPGVLFISARLHPPGDPNESPSVRAPITVGYGLQAADIDLALWTAPRYVQFRRAVEGALALPPSICPYTAPCQGSACFLSSPRIPGDYAERLGRYRTGFPYEKKEVKCRQSSSWTRERLTTKQLSAY